MCLLKLFTACTQHYQYIFIFWVLFLFSFSSGKVDLGKIFFTLKLWFHPFFIFLMENVMLSYLNFLSLNFTSEISYMSCWVINSPSSRHQSTPLKTAYFTIQSLYIVFHLLHKLNYLDCSIIESAPKDQFPMSYTYLQDLKTS